MRQPARLHDVTFIDGRQLIARLDENALIFLDGLGPLLLGCACIRIAETRAQLIGFVEVR